MIYKNSKGIEYYLHRVVGVKNKAVLYYFSKEKGESIDLPEGFEVIESPITKMPVARKVKTE